MGQIGHNSCTLQQGPGPMLSFVPLRIERVQLFRSMRFCAAQHRRTSAHGGDAAPGRLCLILGAGDGPLPNVTGTPGGG
jgi:hypothetical protein